jgi:hypothetical protein
MRIIHKAIHKHHRDMSGSLFILTEPKWHSGITKLVPEALITDRAGCSSLLQTFYRQNDSKLQTEGKLRRLTDYSHK